MRLSNFILTFILALFISLTLHGQSSSHVISVENDGESIHIEFKEGKVVVLKIDGETIPQSEYSKHQKLIDKYQKRSKSGRHPEEMDKHQDVQSVLIEKMNKYLVSNENMNTKIYEYKLTAKYLKLNGKKLSTERHDDCKEIFEDTTGKTLTDGSSFHVDIAPGSRSVSLNINE